MAPLFDVSASPAIESFYETLSNDDRDELDLIIVRLRLDPWIDDVTKFDYSSARATMLAYDAGRWAILYRVVARRIELLVAWHHPPESTNDGGSR
ncbi:MAG: hypothetical protein HYX51_05645 [Chloroflexi bacterium]|nr:hypothetical protein [Chloroflexota bacterium]